MADLTESDDLDDRVVRALDYYRALVESGKHSPGPRARASLIALAHSVAAHLRAQLPVKGDGTWH